MRFFRLKYEIKEPLVRLEFVTLPLKYKSNVCFSYSFFIVVINVPPMRWWPSIYRFQLFKPFPLPLTDFQLCFRLSLRKGRPGEECSGKCNRYTSLQTNYFLSACLVKLCTVIDKQPKKIHNHLSTFKNSNLKSQGVTEVIFMTPYK